MQNTCGERVHRTWASESVVCLHASAFINKTNRRLLWRKLSVAQIAAWHAVHFRAGASDVSCCAPGPQTLGPRGRIGRLPLHVEVSVHFFWRASLAASCGCMEAPPLRERSLQRFVGSVPLERETLGWKSRPHVAGTCWTCLLLPKLLPQLWVGNRRWCPAASERRQCSTTAFSQMRQHQKFRRLPHRESHLFLCLCQLGTSRRWPVQNDPPHICFSTRNLAAASKA